MRIVDFLLGHYRYDYSKKEMAGGCRHSSLHPIWCLGGIRGVGDSNLNEGVREYEVIQDKHRDPLINSLAKIDTDLIELTAPGKKIAADPPQALGKTA